MNHHIDPDADECYETALDSVAAASPSVAVCRAVATLTDKRPDDLDSLCGSVDPDALDRLVASSDHGGCCVSFRYEGFDVEIDTDRQLRLVPVDE